VRTPPLSRRQGTFGRSPYGSMDPHRTSACKRRNGSRATSSAPDAGLSLRARRHVTELATQGRMGRRASGHGCPPFSADPKGSKAVFAAQRSDGIRRLMRGAAQGRPGASPDRTSPSVGFRRTFLVADDHQRLDDCRHHRSTKMGRNRRLHGSCSSAGAKSIRAKTGRARPRLAPSFRDSSGVTPVTSEP